MALYRKPSTRRRSEPGQKRIEDSVARAVKRIKLARPAIRLADYPLAQAFLWTDNGTKRRSELH